jgi:alanine racemase
MKDMKYTYATWIEINQHAFEHNVSQFRQILGTAQLGIVIKANAYGHGMLTIAQMAEHNPQVNWYCVAQLSEALTLREHHFKKSILVMGHIDRPIETAIKKNIDLTLFQYEMAEELEALGRAHDYVFNVHIKIDSGLARLGIAPEDAIEFIKKIETCSYIKINGIYSHFAESQNKDQTYTIQQTNTFKAVVDAVQELKIKVPLIHLANSASAETTSLPFCNMVRIGAGIYGLWSSPEVQARSHLKFPEFSLKPILCWKARIMHIKTVPAHSYIGYDRTYYATKDMRIASLAIGYYDGYDFRLFNKASAIIRNEYAPVVGRISMNISSLDITHIPQAKEGDEVILMGNYPQIHPYELGMLAGNPNVREITTKINAAIPRVIINELQLHNQDNFLYTKAPHKDNPAI